MRKLQPALLAVLAACCLIFTGCGGSTSGLPVTDPIASGPTVNQPPTSPNDQTGRVTMTVNLANLGLPATRGGSAYDGYLFGVQLSFLEGAGASVYRQVPVDTDGNATISVELKIGRWRMDEMAVKRDNTPILISNNTVEFIVTLGGNTPVNVTLVPATGTATFTVSLGGNNTDGGIVTSRDGLALTANDAHRFTLDTRQVVRPEEVQGYILMFRCYRDGEDPAHDYLPCGGVRLFDGQNLVTTGDNWQVYVDTMGSQYADGSQATWQQGIRCRAGLLVEFEIDFSYLNDQRNFGLSWQGKPVEYTHLNADLFEVRRQSNGTYAGTLIEPAEYQIVW